MSKKFENSKKVKELEALLRDALEEKNHKEVKSLTKKLNKLVNPGFVSKIVDKFKDFLDDEDDLTLRSDYIDIDSRRWQCGLCTTINQPQLVNCISCGEFRGDTYTYEQRERLSQIKSNKTLSSDAIELSSASNKASSALVNKSSASTFDKEEYEYIDETNMEWSCTLCTTLNEGHLINCQSCLQKKGENFVNEQRGRLQEIETEKKLKTNVEYLEIKENNSWKCEICEEENPTTELVCTLCDQPAC